MDKFSSYQLGVMLYDLLTAQNSEDKLEWSKKLQLAACDPEIKNTAEALDFSADIFNTPKGQMAKELIQAALQSDLQLRPGIDEFIARLNYIAPGIAETADAWPEATMGTSAQTCRNMKNNLLHMKNQGDAPDVSYEQGFKNM